MEIGQVYCLNTSTSNYPKGTQCVLEGIDGTTCIISINGGQQVVNCGILSTCISKVLLNEPLVSLKGAVVLEKGTTAEILEQNGSYTRIKSKINNRRYWIPTSIIKV